MTDPPHLSRRSLLGIAGAGAGALLLGACGDDSGSPQQDPNAPQTVRWWHIQTTDPMKPIWAAFAKEYETARTNVKINITDQENDAFKQKLTTVTQAGDPPDLFQSWGGGVLKQQVDAGLVKDLTNDVSSWIGELTPIALEQYKVNGKIYAIPFDMGMVGFWYNKELFSRAGISATPTTWGELLDAVRKLKAAGITPIALGGKDKWPGHFYWSYLAIRIAGVDALKQAAADKNFDNPDFVAAGARLKELVDLQPFQKGFLGAGYEQTDSQASTMGNAQAAFELMGQWAPSVQAAWSASKQGIGDKLAFFPFPAVDGGKGKMTDAFGGGNGFAVGKNAPPATVDFLKFIVNAANQRKSAESGAVLPANKGAVDGIKTANQKLVAQTFAASTGFQLYLDQAFAPAVGTQVNDSVAALIAGQKAPDQVTKEITAAAKNA